jgi:hypothetical protein
VVFTLRVREPQSAAARIWNLAQSACGAASVVLIVLKVTGLVTWSWWWVLSPLWLSGLLLAAALCAVLALYILNLRERFSARR